MNRKLGWLIVLIPVLLLAVLGCAGTPRGSSNAGGSGEQPLAAPPEDALYRDAKAAPADRARDLLSYMTLDEKIGQMIQVDRSFLQNPKHIATFALGSILSGGGSAPRENTPQGWADMIDSFQEQALSTRLGIPLLYGIDAVHGNNNLLGATIFPHNIGLGAAGDPDLVERIARATSLETAAIGVNWNFAPTVAVPQDIRWGRTYEGFGEDTQLVSSLGAAAVRGYQGPGGVEDPRDGLARPDTILATLKHFIGDGGTVNGRDQGNVEMPMEEIRQLFLPPYVAGLAEGAGSVMASFNSIYGKKVHGDAEILDGMLRRNLGFQGLLVSDWAAVKQLPGTAMQQITKAVMAGIDMIMVPDDYVGTIRNLKASVLSDGVTMARIDEAVYRILEVKFALGLFENPFAKREFFDHIGSDAHRELAREAVAKSVVVLENRGQVLPLTLESLQENQTPVLLVAGYKADDIGSQSGGWTLSWQGFTGNKIPGTTFLGAVTDYAASQGVEVIYRPDGKLQEGDPRPAAVLAVIGESPYAEMEGDSMTLGLSRADLGVISSAAALDIPLVTILYSGRPVDIRQVRELSSALVAAWLPGTQAQGIADVLFGLERPSGRLSYTWPADPADLPLGDGVGQDEVLYPLGYGLTY
ncbi:glycoside hydrolase family 3 protein [Spirochaeta lutea]|uniref:glycoside hydrolase family 3 protein n=1 Tax=Spirochaeta lutea TaxID=1480694 RepID=UPI00068BD371|nr:glycoside hydrolase family 3 N-terminal domain-containing protein [Spirochaeta lutea]